MPAAPPPVTGTVQEGMRTARVARCVGALIAALFVLTAGAGCSLKPAPPIAQNPPPVELPPPPSLPPDQPDPETGLRPNEAGRVLILEYHEIGDREGDWERHYDNFRKDLERLYRAGYRLVPLQDVLQRRINLPRGTSPVVITFDDADAGQFRYIIRDGQPVIDPDCAVGILEEFARAHPDFGKAATFYVYFAAAPFRQKEYVADKLRTLVANGYEIGNHTYGHANLSRLSLDAMRDELGKLVKAVQAAAPGCPVESLALPYGGYPRDRAALLEGTGDGVQYHNRGVLLVGAEPAPSPYSTAFKPLAIPRVQARTSELDKWLTYLETHPHDRYVSDGDPDTVTVPEQSAGLIDAASLGGAKLVTYKTPQ